MSNILPFPTATEPDPIVSKQQARRIAAKLFQVDETAIACRDRGGSWIGVAAPDKPQQMWFRGATWFDVLQKVHAFLIEAVKNNPEAAEEAAK